MESRRVVSFSRFVSINTVEPYDEQYCCITQNIKKSLCYTLSSKPVELYPYLLYLIFAIPQMASSITILAIDLFTDNLPPIALGYETAEKHVMKGYPRHMRKDKVINCE